MIELAGNSELFIVICFGAESLAETRLTSNLRPTARECVHLVTRGHFRSRDKNGDHNIRYAIGENFMLHANFMGICFIEPKLMPIDVLHCGNRDFRLFCSCDLDLYPITFICEPDLYSPEIYRMCKSELPTLRLSKVII